MNESSPKNEKTSSKEEKQLHWVEADAWINDDHQKVRVPFGTQGIVVQEGTNLKKALVKFNLQNGKTAEVWVKEDEVKDIFPIPVLNADGTPGEQMMTKEDAEHPEKYPDKFGVFEKDKE